MGLQGRPWSNHCLRLQNAIRRRQDFWIRPHLRLSFGCQKSRAPIQTDSPRTRRQDRKGVAKPTKEGPRHQEGHDRRRKEEVNRKHSDSARSLNSATLFRQIFVEMGLVEK